MKLFVKNIAKDVNESQLESIFALYGTIESTKIVYDKITWESRGFGFVEFTKKEDGEKAMSILNGKELRGKALIVEVAVDKK